MGSTRSRVLHLLVLLSFSVGVHAQLTIGAVGDSITDEYLDSGTAANTDIAAYNWVEMLAQSRPLDLDWGEYRPPGSGSWPDHRAGGYQYNYAKVAGTASDAARMKVDMILFIMEMEIDSAFVGSRYVSDQVSGLLGENVNLAVVAAGSNDYFYHTHHFSMTGNSSRNNTDPDDAFNEDVAHSLLEHVDRLLEAETQVLLAYIPPGTAGGEADQPTLDGIAAANAILEAGAAERGIPMVDLFGFEQNEDGSIDIGGLHIPQDSIATEADLVAAETVGAGKCRSDNRCAGPSHKEKYIADDGLHPNTIVQGLIANQVIYALNDGFGLAIAPLSESEILGYTGS